MYFDLVPYYLATLINDISLMNFSNRLAGLLYISSLPILCFLPVLFFQDSVSNLQRFNLFYSVTKLRLVTPLLFGIAKVEIFLLLSRVISNFFFFLFPGLFLTRLKELTLTNLYTFISSNLPSTHPFHCFPSSEAGCKSRKIIAPRKYYSTLL